MEAPGVLRSQLVTTWETNKIWRGSCTSVETINIWSCSPHIGLRLGVGQDVDMAGLARSHCNGEILPGTDLQRGNVDQEVGVTIAVVEAHQHWAGVVRVRAIIIITNILKRSHDDQHYWGSCCRWWDYITLHILSCQSCCNRIRVEESIFTCVSVWMFCFRWWAEKDLGCPLSVQRRWNINLNRSINIRTQYTQLKASRCSYRSEKGGGDRGNISSFFLWRISTNFSVYWQIKPP